MVRHKAAYRIPAGDRLTAVPMTPWSLGRLCFALAAVFPAEARHFQWPPEQIGERSSERVRAGKRAAKFIACTVCEQVVQSNFPKPHALDSIRKTFSSEELHERHDAKGSCAMKRLAQLFKRQKLEVTGLPDGTAEIRTAKTEPFYEEINKSELAFHWKSFALQHACSEVFRSDAEDVHRAMEREFERLAQDLPHEHDDEVQELLLRAVQRGCQASRFCRAARTQRVMHHHRPEL